MTRYLTSDLHLGHTNIITYTERPYADAEQMNEDLVRRWNSVVDDDDVVFVLGDLALGRLEISLAWVKKLAGTKVLVPGNHDKMFGAKHAKYAHSVDRYLDAGIADVEHEQIDLSLLPNLTVIACHFPYAEDSGDHAEDRFASYRPIDKGARLVHGHRHGAYRKHGRMIDVGVDAWGGYPVSFETVAATFDDPARELAPLEWEA